MSKKIVVGLDLDGVLRDITTPTLEVYKQKFDNSSNLRYQDVRHYDIRVEMPRIKSTYDFYVKNAQRLFEFGGIEGGTRDLIEELKRRECHIALVSHQFRGIEHYSTKWLKRNEIYYDSLHFTKDKNLVKSDILLDDCPDNLVKHSNPVCKDQPWNQEYKGKRIGKLEELLDFI